MMFLVIVCACIQAVCSKSVTQFVPHANGTLEIQADDIVFLRNRTMQGLISEVDSVQLQQAALRKDLSDAAASRQDLITTLSATVASAAQQQTMLNNLASQLAMTQSQLAATQTQLAAMQAAASSTATTPSSSEMIFVAGGDGKSTEYYTGNADNGRGWKDGPQMLQSREGPGLAYFNNKLYVFGGRVSDATTEVLINMKWQYSVPMPSARRRVRAVIYRGRVFVIGGAVGTSDAGVKTVEAFNGTHWDSSVPNMKTARSYCATAVFNNRIYVLGGWPRVRNVEYYDGGNAWVDIGDALTVHRGYASAAVFRGQLHVFGGVGTQNENVISLVQAFDVDMTNSTFGVSVTRRLRHDTVVYKGAVWLIGGDGSSKPRLEASIYNGVVAFKTEGVDMMRKARRFPAAVVIS
eukprot:m.293803 g.293803  ORF g.293803 m.293803 type:complete len:408 (+) comp32208_c0_seq1:131-1354(+)